MSGQMKKSVVIDVWTAFSNEIPQLVTPLSHGLDPVSGDCIAPRNVNVSEMRTAFGQGLEGQVGDRGATV